SGFSSPDRRSAPGRRSGSVALSARRRPRRSRRTPSASGRRPSAANRVHRRASRWAPSQADAASGRRPSLPACSASVASSCVLSFTLTGERLLQFQLNRNTDPGGDVVSFDCLHKINDWNADGFDDVAVWCKEVSQGAKGRTKTHSSTTVYSFKDGHFGSATLS